MPVVAFEMIYVDQVWVEELESTIERVLDVLMSELHLPDDERTKSPSGEDFDGCAVCVRREIMVLTMNATLDATREGLVQRLVA